MMKIIFVVSTVTALFFLGSFSAFADIGIASNNDNSTLAKLVLECQKQDNPDKICTLFNLIQTIQRTPGPPGPAGSPGSQILVGAGIPSSSLGSNNDLYLDNSIGNYYKKISGTWTSQGSLRGPTGSPGATGSQGPSGPQGLNGTNGAQGPPGPQGLPGIVGSPGSQIFTDVGVPNLSLGSNNDFYLDTSSGNYYKKISGTWTAQGSLRGPPGSPGTQGPRGFNGTDGTQGLPGPPGPPGPRGFNGTNGANGPSGPQGPPGFNGTNGINGAQGLPGPRGFNGTNGTTGPIGPQGPQGDVGPQGPRGFNGTDGAQGLPGPRGFNGTNGAIGPIGPRGFNGTNGAQGLPGSQIFTARGIPSLSLGSNNDFYLDNSTGNYYKKISNSWTIQGNLVGPQGPPGTPANTTALQNQINSLNQQLLFTQLGSSAFNLISYWKFDGGGLGLNDFSGLGNNGIVTGTTSFVTGKIGNAFNFNGASYITIPTSATYNFEKTNSFSVAFWYKSSSTTNAFIMGKRISGGSSAGIEIQKLSSQMNFRLFNTLTTNELNVGNYPLILDGSWHHFVWTYDGSNSPSGVKLYVDGSLASITTTTNNLSASILNSVNWSLGARPDGSSPDISQLDDVRLYNKVLSSTEVSAIFHSS